MAYSPTHTFPTPSGVVEANEVKDNLEGVKDYIDGGMASGDLATTEWVEPKHIARGHYQGLNGTHKFTSGLVSGRVSSSSERSYLGDGPTGRTTASEKTYKDFPNTGRTFYLDAPADVMFQISAAPISPALNYATKVLQRTHAKLMVDGTLIDDLHLTTFRFHTVANAQGDTTKSWSGFYVMKNLAAGEHTISLQGFCEGRYTYLSGWSLSLEAYYL